MSTSEHGSHKKRFDVVGESGYWIQCCVLGRNVDSVAYVESQDVVCYAGTGGERICTFVMMALLPKEIVSIQSGKACRLVIKG